MNDRDFDRRLAELVRRRSAPLPPLLERELQRRLQMAGRPVRRARLLPLHSLRLAAASLVVLCGLGVGISLLRRDFAPALPALLRTPALARTDPGLLPLPAVNAVLASPRPAAAPARRQPAAAPPPPDEIRTELEISGSDIRIIWVQRPDFALRRNPS